MAIKQPEIYLSHPPIATKPSKLSAPTTVSIESAIKSRLGNDYRMPSVPIEIPSDTVIVLKINGTAPASLAPFFDASARSSIWILQGVTSLPVLARSEEHTSELQSRFALVCRLLLVKTKHN